ERTNVRGRCPSTRVRTTDLSKTRRPGQLLAEHQGQQRRPGATANPEATTGSPNRSPPPRQPHSPAPPRPVKQFRLATRQPCSGELGRALVLDSLTLPPAWAAKRYGSEGRERVQDLATDEMETTDTSS